jgi:hypothetical protein
MFQVTEPSGTEGRCRTHRTLSRASITKETKKTQNVLLTDTLQCSLTDEVSKETDRDTTSLAVFPKLPKRRGTSPNEKGCM